MANPLKSLVEDMSLIRMALLPAAPFQPESMPSSLTKIKLAVPPLESRKPLPPAKTIPEAGPPVVSVAVGILTLGLAGIRAPSPVYTSLTPCPFAFTQAIPDGAQA